MARSYQPRGGLGRAVHSFEETAIAVLLGLMTLLTFVNVILRYTAGTAPRRWFEGATGLELPNSLIWGLEVVLILFAWLVVFGVSYGFKVTAHLGVDALTNHLPRREIKSPLVQGVAAICGFLVGIALDAALDELAARSFGVGAAFAVLAIVAARWPRKGVALIAGGITLIYALLLLKGSWDYWAPFAGLQPTEGRWFPTGIADVRSRSFYVTDQVPMLDWLRWMEPFTLNRGYPPEEWEAYDKLPRFIPYVIMPVGAALITFRVVQAILGIWRDERESLIVSHEAEDAVDEVAHMNREG